MLLSSVSKRVPHHQPRGALTVEESSERSLMEQQLPAPAEKLAESVRKLFSEIGPTNLTRRVLVKRLGAEYGVDFEPQKRMLDEIAERVMLENKKVLIKAIIAVQEAEQKLQRRRASKKKSSNKKKHHHHDRHSTGRKRGKAKREPADPSAKPDGPKRAKTAFFWFADAHRAAVCQSVRADNNGKMDVSAVGSRLGKMWHALSADERAKYEAMAQEDKLRYKTEKSSCSQ